MNKTIRTGALASLSALTCILAAIPLVAEASRDQPTFRPSYQQGVARFFWQDEWKEEFQDGLCQVKLESKPGEFKREVKCKDGVGADWQGEWKTEFRDGPCLVKQDVKRDEFKEEVKCTPAP